MTRVKITRSMDLEDVVEASADSLRFRRAKAELCVDKISYLEKLLRKTKDVSEALIMVNMVRSALADIDNDMDATGSILMGLQGTLQPSPEPQQPEQTTSEELQAALAQAEQLGDLASSVKQELDEPAK